MPTSRDDPDYVFEDYKGFIIASHKDNVPERDINNLIIVYDPKDFPNHGFIVGLDESKNCGYRKSYPHNMEDAKFHIDWHIEGRKESLIRGTSIEIGQQLKEKGYDHFNVKHSGIGISLKDAFKNYGINLSDMNSKPGFPIYASTCLSATDPGSPSYWARFALVEDAVKGMRIGSVELALFECHDGRQRVSIKRKLKSMEEIPSKADAINMIDRKWKFMQALKTGKQDSDKTDNTFNEGAQKQQSKDKEQSNEQERIKRKGRRM